MKILTYVCLLFFVFTGLKIFSHGRSEEFLNLLRSPKPEYLKIGGDLSVKIIEQGKEKEEFKKHIYKHGANLENGKLIVSRVDIEIKGIGVVLKKEIDSISLNPKSKLLLLNSGPSATIYRIKLEDKKKPIDKVEVYIPNINFGQPDDKRWFITDWFWLNDNVLIGHSELEDYKGEKVLETNLYAYDIKKQILYKLNLPKFLVATSYEISGINEARDSILIDYFSQDDAKNMQAVVKIPTKILMKK